VAAAELGSSRCWLPNRCSLGGTPPSRTPPASGVRGEMLTYGALTGPHGGYSELDTGGAQSAGASPNDVCTGWRLWLAAERRLEICTTEQARKQLFQIRRYCTAVEKQVLVLRFGVSQLSSQSPSRQPTLAHALLDLALARSSGIRILARVICLWAFQIDNMIENYDWAHSVAWLMGVNGIVN
jgi:hypothetical protein